VFNKVGRILTENENEALSRAPIEVLGFGERVYKINAQITVSIRPMGHYYKYEQLIVA